MKNLFAGLLAIASFSINAQTSKIPKEVVLTHRILNTCEADSCYFDMFLMKQEYGRGLALEFGNDWGDNILGVTQVVDEFGLIADVGEGSCSKLTSSYDHDRNKDPWLWLVYSDAWDTLNRSGTQEITASENHCYLMYKTNSTQQVVVAFHVKTLNKNRSIVIDELEVFKKSTIE